MGPDIVRHLNWNPSIILAGSGHSSLHHPAPEEATDFLSGVRKSKWILNNYKSDIQLQLRAPKTGRPLKNEVREWKVKKNKLIKASPKYNFIPDTEQ